MQPLIDARNISLSRNGRSILENVRSPSARKHWPCSPNGSGKTTLLTIITAYTWPGGDVECWANGTEPWTSRGAAADRDGIFRPVRAGSAAGYPERCGSLGAVCQPGIWRSRGIPTGNAPGRSLPSGLRGHRDRPYGVLSFGERQRALIGRALMPEPRSSSSTSPRGAGHSRTGNSPESPHSLAAAPEGPSLILVHPPGGGIPPRITTLSFSRTGSVLASGKSSPPSPRKT